MNKTMKQLKLITFLRKTLLLMLIALVPTVASAKNKRGVSFYLDRGFIQVDMVTCNVEKQGNAYYIVTRAYMHPLIDDNPTLQIRTFSGDVMKLSGQTVDKASKDNDKGNIIAKFRITPQQFEKIKSGIKRFRVSPTSGGSFDKEFRRDKIGKKLYKLYLRAKDF